MKIRQSEARDLSRIMEVYDVARGFMRKSGNDCQWINGFPQKSLIEADIAAGQSFVFVDDSDFVHGVFAFIVGVDHTYNEIDGAWLNDEPYGTIHRIGTDGTFSGAVRLATDFCAARLANLAPPLRNIKIDTHEKNTPMQHVLEKNGYKRCGIIHIDDGTPRVAFQLSILNY